jgi:Tol biopolymer transport system component
MRVGREDYASASGKLEIWSVNPDGTDSHIEFTDTESARAPLAFSWSPDGGSIAWVRNWPERYGEVVLRELATGKERQLTFDRKPIDEVLWATNGMILFVSTRSGQSNLWMIPAGGGEATQITQGAVPILGARISSDNRTLVYLQQETVGSIWVSAIDGSDARQLTSSDIYPRDLTFSPDGKQISASLSDLDVLRSETHLFLMDRDGSNQRQLTSGAERASDPRWSPDGKWLAYSTRGAEEPPESSKVYIIQPLNPRPRLLCRGTGPIWLDNENLIVYGQAKTLRYSTGGGAATQVYRDSTYAVPIAGQKQMLFSDHRIGHEGVWTVSVDSLGKEVGSAKKIVPANVDHTRTDDCRFLIYRKGEDELWRVWTSSGKEERIGKALPGDAAMMDVSRDGKEILWVKYAYPSKLVLVKELFE